MASENEQIVRRYLDHFNATGEYLWDLFDPEIVFIVRPDLGHSTYNGIDGMKRAMESFREVWATRPTSRYSRSSARTARSSR